METHKTPTPQAEDLAQLLNRVMDKRGLTRTEIAHRAGVSVSIVSAWASRKRGTRRGPSHAVLERLADALGEPRERVFAAAARKTPGPLTDDKRQAVLAVFAELTEEQQETKLVEMRALVEHNRTGQ